MIGWCQMSNFIDWIYSEHFDLLKVVFFAVLLLILMSLFFRETLIIVFSAIFNGG